MLFASIWDSFLVEASVLVLCQYAATLTRGEGADLFLQSGPFQNFQKIFQELTWFESFMWDVVVSRNHTYFIYLTYLASLITKPFFWIVELFYL